MNGKPVNPMLREAANSLLDLDMSARGLGIKDVGSLVPMKDRTAVLALAKQYAGKIDLYNASASTQSRADAAASMIPLIARARELVNDPEVQNNLGVFNGRMSEVGKRVGTIGGKTAEFYGTLKSIYSLGGTMHGWRSIKVAEEFEKAYGGLHTNPAGLQGGMNAMSDAANSVYHTAYHRDVPGYVRPRNGTGSGGHGTGPAPDKFKDNGTYTGESGSVPN
jgi:hypothetical protein